MTTPRPSGVRLGVFNLKKVGVIASRRPEGEAGPVIAVSLGLFLALLALSSSAHAGPPELATQIFRKLNGYVLPQGTVRTQMEGLITQGRMVDAAHIATEDDAFYNVTLAAWAAALSNREEDAKAPVNDFITMVVGHVRDGRDARELLYENFTYVGNHRDTNYPCTGAGCSYNYSDPDAHFDALTNSRINLRRFLVRQTPQWPSVAAADSAGVLTSRQWARAHFNAGTNRRAVQYALQEFLCSPIAELMAPAMPDIYYNRIRRDVDRAPGGDANTFRTTCRGCHGPMDAFGGAFAFFDNAIPPQQLRVVPKMNQNGTVFAAGYVTTDNSWLNYFTQDQNASLGWRGAKSGYGVRSLGQAIANSEAFSKCMAKRVFRSMCSRDPKLAENPIILTLAQSFEGNNYDLRRLFEEASVLPNCIGK